MKYYIPIHRDNVDNVITAEGIAPVTCYTSRGFGYNYFKSMPDLPSGDFLCLFEHIPEVLGSKKSESDDWVFIEIDHDAKKNVETTSFDGGLIVDSPISIFPWNCRFLFQTEEGLRQAVLMCRSSLCNKTWFYYEFDIIDTNLPRKKIEYGKIPTVEAETAMQDIVAEGARCNRLKGFLYAFILGRYVSMSQTLARLLQTEKYMYDIATSLTGLQGYEATSFLKQLDELEVQYEHLDPNRTELKKRWDEMVSNRFKHTEAQQIFENLITELGGEAIMKSNFAKSSDVEVRPRYKVQSMPFNDWTIYKKELEEYTLKHIQKFRMKNGDLNTDGDFSVELQQIMLNPKYGIFYGRLIHLLLEGSEWLTLDNLRLHRLDVASELTRMARDIMIESGMAWEGSKERSFLNYLRQHIAQGGVFDIASAPDVILRSIAIFLLKGDDYEEMLRYMEYNAQTDYRFALGLWGACVGFADMPKTAIQRMKLDCQGENRIYVAASKHLTVVPDDLHLTRHTYQFSKKEQQPLTLSHKLLAIVRDKSVGLTAKQAEEVINVWRETDGRTDKQFFDKIAKIKGIGKVKLNKIKEGLNTQNQPADEVQLELFAKQREKIGQSFNTAAWQYIEPLLPDDPIIKRRVREDLAWFVSHSRRQEDNMHIISDYKLHLYQKAHPRHPRYAWTADFFGRLDIDSIIAQLEKVYL